MPATSIPLLLEALEPGTLTLLPTAAAARALRHAYNQTQQAAGKKAWEPAPILSWSQFLDHLWSEAITTGLETRLLLNTAQDHTLWVEVVSANQPESTLTAPDSLADLAREAWTLAHAFSATGRLRTFATTHDTRTFAAWAEAFQRLCDRNAYLSRAALEPALQLHIEARTLPAPPALTLAGFPERTPAQQNLLAALSTAGTQITELTLKNPGPTEDVGAPPFAPLAKGGVSGEARPLSTARAILTATNEPQELHTTSIWLHNFIHKRHQSGQPSRIAVLLPDPTEATTLESTFREILAPELQSIHADPSSTPWEFASNTPLTSIPLIATALDLAHFVRSPLELNKLSALLLSPYLNTPISRNTNAQFDAQILRKAHLLRPEIDLATLLRLSRSSTITTTWLQPFIQHITNVGNLETPRTFADWAEFLRSLIASTGWPGDPESLSPLEFHATQSWDSLLDQLATLDFRGRRVPYAAALQTLTRLATATTFNPPSNHSPIQIMSPAAAIGQTFDALILLRATDTNYPPAERPNPLIPWALQATLNMPGASPTQANTRARQTLTDLLASAPNILFTYAAETPDGPQRLSPILSSLNWPQLDPGPPETPNPPLEELLIPDSDPLPPLPSPHVRGGAHVLKLQAACGFRAFAEMRLWATELDAPDAGFDARETGNLLHRAMSAFWAGVRSQANLRDLPLAERRTLLTRCIDDAIDHRLQLTNSWDEAYLDLQKERLLHLLQQWLDEELRRGPFEVIRLEQEESIPLGPLDLKLRIDRLDAVNGGVFLVDYKTGYAAKQADWLGERPDEPQLPLYALLAEPGQLKGLAFAKVRAGKDMKWLGYQSEPGLLPSRSVDDLQPLLEDWRATLTSLAEDFANASVAVNPKDYPTTCTHCAQRLLCRIDSSDPAAFLAAPTDTEDPDEDPTHG